MEKSLWLLRRKLEHLRPQPRGFIHVAGLHRLLRGINPLLKLHAFDPFLLMRPA
jgi:hypothetical protein